MNNNNATATTLCKFVQFSIHFTTTIAVAYCARLALDVGRVAIVAQQISSSSLLKIPRKANISYKYSCDIFYIKQRRLRHMYESFLTIIQIGILNVKKYFK